MLDEREAQRLKFKPDKVRFLFVGESVPANGTFFYLANSNLHEYTQRAFERVGGTRWRSGIDFLRFFRDKGFYIDDLCPMPVNNLDATTRKQIRQKNIAPLADRIQLYRPETIIVVKASISGYVREAVTKARLATITSVYSLPFPSMSHQLEYVDDLEAILTLPQFDGLGEK